MSKIFAVMLLSVLCVVSGAFALENDSRVFKIDPDIKVEKAHFHNRFGIELVGDLYMPKEFDAAKKYSALAVAGPFGAVKEQVSGLYAQEMAKAGFVAMAFDPSFTGESGGAVRYAASPEINTEDFSAAVDFLATRDFVDPEKIGIIGICGWGGIGLNAVAADTRIKAAVASTMYDMSRVSAK
ncbi:MAG: alpha/beta hydrolase, partial [Synergistaceae bacterium]|nr:alpha/beta hydrolase [Synergistaceae bacterium]